MDSLGRLPIPSGRLEPPRAAKAKADPARAESAFIVARLSEAYPIVQVSEPASRLERSMSFREAFAASIFSHVISSAVGRLTSRKTPTGVGNAGDRKSV